MTKLIPETNRFGNHRTEITENYSKMIKFSSAILLCVMVMLISKKFALRHVFTVFPVGHLLAYNGLRVDVHTTCVLTPKAPNIQQRTARVEVKTFIF